MTDATGVPAPGRTRAAGPGRRQLLLGVGAAGWGAALGLGAEALTRPTASPRPAPMEDVAGLRGRAVVPFHGTHQAVLRTPPQAHSVHLALDLAPGQDRDSVRRLMRLLSSDAARLTAGAAALADTEPELAQSPARLTVTFGFGPGVVAVAGGTAPDWLAPLPAFGVDRLEEAWSGGDLLIEVAADDPTALAHAVRMLTKDARAFATPRWRQDGFRHAYGTRPEGTTMRNLFGQVDGTVNPALGGADFAEQVLVTDGWLAGGSALVIRRIAMDLDGWDEVDRVGRENAVGRRLADGAPLTSPPEGAERDAVDLAALGPNGFPVIPAESHVRRAMPQHRREKFFRRGYNYDGADGAGLLFTAYQADPLAQFVPVQRRLDELDILNRWTTPVGSSVFAVPPGCAEGGYVGETLLEA